MNTKETKQLDAAYKAWKNSVPYGNPSLGKFYTDGKTLFIGEEPVLFPSTDGIQLDKHAPLRLKRHLDRSGIPYRTLNLRLQS